MIYIVCILLIIYPDLYFKADTMFIVKDGTPTEYYITKTRFIGTLILLASAIALFIILIYNIDWYAIL